MIILVVRATTKSTEVSIAKQFQEAKALTSCKVEGEKTYWMEERVTMFCMVGLETTR